MYYDPPRWGGWGWLTYFRAHVSLEYTTTIANKRRRIVAHGATAVQ
jgi:hypothetical protein